MENRFRIALCPVAMSGPLHLTSETGMVVNLAVEDDPHAVVLVAHRLMASGNVDDRQPPVGQPDTPVHPQSRSIGTSMLLHVRHMDETGTLYPLPRIKFHDTRNGAHR
jgi:hypothetical protein